MADDAPQTFSIEDAEAAYAAGDFARVRKLLAGLPAEARKNERALTLARATSVDPMHVIALLLCLGALAAIAAQYLL